MPSLKFQRGKKRSVPTSSPGQNQESRGPNLKDVIRSGYGDGQAREALAQQGYVYDPLLSSHNNSVYYHPEKKKMIFNVAGTHNFSDVITDTAFILGDIRDTRRYHNAVNTFRKAKEKYKPEETTLVGHSLGGGIVSRMPVDNTTKKITYNKAAGLDDLFRKADSHEQAYRTTNDPVSLLSALNSNSKTIGTNSLNPIEAHSTDALIGKNIVV